MSNELQVPVRTPILSTLNKGLFKKYKTDFAGLAKKGAKALEMGVATPENLKSAAEIMKEGNDADKMLHETRLHLTRPVSKIVKDCIAEEEAIRHSHNFADINRRVTAMVLDEKARQLYAKQRAEREYAEKQRKAAEEARKEQERREKISLAKGGDGDVDPVLPEAVDPPVEAIAVFTGPAIKLIVDKDKIRQAIDTGTREILGVKIYQVWEFEITEAKLVPNEYRKPCR